MQDAVRLVLTARTLEVLHEGAVVAPPHDEQRLRAVRDLLEGHELPCCRLQELRTQSALTCGRSEHTDQVKCLCVALYLQYA